MPLMQINFSRNYKDIFSLKVVQETHPFPQLLWTEKE